MAAECPLCRSNLTCVRWQWITNVLGLTKPYFKCPNCKWKKYVKDIHKDGGFKNKKKKRPRHKGNRNRRNNNRRRHRNRKKGN